MGSAHFPWPTQLDASLFPCAWGPTAFQPTSPQLPLASRREGTWQELGWRPSMCHVDTLQVSWGKKQLSGTASMWGQRGRAFGPHPCSSGRSWRGQVPGRDLGGTCPGSPRLALTFSLETWWENGQVPSVFLHVPRTNLCMRRRRFEGRLPKWARALYTPSSPRRPAGRSPGTHGHLLGVVDVGALLAAVAPAKTVVVHAVFRLLPAPPLPGLSDDGQTALQGPAVDTRTHEAREARAHRALPAQSQGHTWPGSGYSC